VEFLFETPQKNIIKRQANVSPTNLPISPIGEHHWAIISGKKSDSSQQLPAVNNIIEKSKGCPSGMDGMPHEILKILQNNLLIPTQNVIISS
jgi:hypothetical protein